MVEILYNSKIKPYLNAHRGVFYYDRHRKLYEHVDGPRHAQRNRGRLTADYVRTPLRRGYAPDPLDHITCANQFDCCVIVLWRVSPTIHLWTNNKISCIKLHDML